MTQNRQTLKLSAGKADDREKADGKKIIFSTDDRKKAGDKKTDQSAFRRRQENESRPPW